MSAFGEDQPPRCALAAEPTRACAPSSEETRAPAGARARILVIDDEPLIGRVIQRSLRAEHDVEVVPSARAALDRLEEGESYDILLSDLLMPGMSGMDLYRELDARHPEMARRTVFLTGGAFTPAAREFIAREPVEWLEKPFELAHIRALVARKLSGEG